MEKVKDSGLVLQMQSFSVHDGDGIRTTIFLHGCPLRCKWCANPDSWTMDETCCQRLTIAEVVKKVSRDEIFYRFSGGGVTFSGGEPTVQHEYLRGLVHAFWQRGIDMWIETCGDFAWDEAGDLFEYFSHVFFDLKCMNAEDHCRWTGRENDRILNNAIKIHRLGIPMTIRIPAIREVNFNQQNLNAAAEFISRHLPGADLEFLPYHNLGHEKYKAHGLDKYIYDFEAPDQTEIQDAEAMFRSRGVEIVSYR